MDRNAIVIALAGNPNSGKTSLFNFITGSHQHVGNYPGVTVERKEGTVTVDDVRVTFVDIPGTYSLSPYSLEEHIARWELLSPNVDGIIVVADTPRLERNLHLASQIIEMGKPVVIALNMFDEFEAEGGMIDIPQLSRILGVPCIPTVGNRGRGVTELMATALKAVRGDIPARGKPPVYSHEMEHAIEAVLALIHGRKVQWNERWTAVNLLAYGSSFVVEGGNVFPGEVFDRVMSIRLRTETLEGRPIQTVIAAGRYGWGFGAVSECVSHTKHQPRDLTERVDNVLLHRVIGFPLFLFILWAMFQLTFTLGTYPQGWIVAGFALLGRGVTAVLPAGLVQSLLVDGVIAGVGGVLSFIPNILLLFLFISILEDSGYMARAAFIMDRVMHVFGLHGKSFLPMLVGFGCTVPAIMATRILENRRDRLITMLIVPFMSCGARLPVYILLAGAFFRPAVAGNVIFSIYLAGVVLSLGIAKVMSIAGGTTTPFVMELPPYRTPTARSVLLHIWERTILYLRKAGTVILTASVVMWFLMSFPRDARVGTGLQSAPAAPRTASAGLAGSPEMGTPDAIAPVAGARINPLALTYAGRFGQLIEPVFAPLGFDWKVGIALVAGFTAKEVIVSTFATTYAVEGAKGPDAIENLKEALRRDPNLNPVKAYGLMLFILIYVPCLAVLGVTRREAGSWLWVVVMVVYTTGLAWSVTWLFLTAARLFT